MSDSSGGATRNPFSLVKLAIGLIFAAVFLISALRLSGAIVALIGRFIIVPLFIVLAGGLVGGYYTWKHNAEQVFSDGRTGVTTRELTESGSLSVDDACYVCGDVSGDATVVSELKEFTFGGRPMLMLGRTDEIYCPDCFEATQGSQAVTGDAELEELLE